MLAPAAVCLIKSDARHVPTFRISAPVQCKWRLAWERRIVLRRLEICPGSTGVAMSCGTNLNVGIGGYYVNDLDPDDSLGNPRLPWVPIGNVAAN